jgi:hypothetical protein
MKKLLIAILGTFTFSAIAGGGWTSSKGKGFYQINQIGLIADEHFTNTGLLDPNVTTGYFSTNFYGEYGITNRWEGQLFLPFLTRTYNNEVVSSVTNDILIPGDQIMTLGDAQVGIKYGWLKTNHWALASGFHLGLPLGVPDGGINENLQTGDGEFNQMLRTDISYVISTKEKWNSYSSVYLAVNNRTNDFSDEFRAGLEWGNGFKNGSMWLISKLNLQESFKNGVAAAQSSTAGIFSNNVEFLQYSFEFAHQAFGKWGYSLSYTDFIRGEITLNAPIFGAGIFLKTN